jgi:hypothetical protein
MASLRSLADPTAVVVVVRPPCANPEKDAGTGITGPKTSNPVLDFFFGLGEVVPGTQGIAGARRGRVARGMSGIVAGNSFVGTPDEPYALPSVYASRERDGRD